MKAEKITVWAVTDKWRGPAEELVDKLTAYYRQMNIVEPLESGMEIQNLEEQLSAHPLRIQLVVGEDYEISGLTLRFDESGLTLTDGNLELQGDFTTMLPRLKQKNLSQELLVRVAKVKGCAGTVRVIDATAGLGEDSLLLAAAGFQVTLFELDPVIAALLADSLKRASKLPELAPIVARMTLIHGDSVEALKKMGEDLARENIYPKELPEVVLLDPMFPARQKSALVKRKFQLLQQLESPCANEDELLNAAFLAHPRKIVIKRPVKGPYLGGKKPSHSLGGKAIRYDCHVLPPIEAFANFTIRGCNLE